MIYILYDIRVFPPSYSFLFDLFYLNYNIEIFFIKIMDFQKLFFLSDDANQIQSISGFFFSIRPARDSILTYHVYIWYWSKDIMEKFIQNIYDHQSLSQEVPPHGDQ